MPTFAVGDIHGHLDALQDLLGQLRGEARQGDTVVFLGDYIDRGPATKQCIDAILRFRKDCDANVVCLLGNHEDWCLRSMRDHRRHSWLLGMEAFDTIRSYSAEAEAVLRKAAENTGRELFQGECHLPYDVFFERLPEDHRRFFAELELYCETPDCLCTHGGLDPRVASLQEQPRNALIWGAGGFPQGYSGVQTIVYGHWNNATLDSTGWPAPTIVGRTIGIDTISHGVLTAVRLPDLRVFQSAWHR